MVAHNPAFCDITWWASNADLTLDIANKMQNMICEETMMHLTCTNMPVDKIDHALQTIKCNGLQNVLALRGDQDSKLFISKAALPAPSTWSLISEQHNEHMAITLVSLLLAIQRHIQTSLKKIMALPPPSLTKVISLISRERLMLVLI
ncbi:hypothetical protein ACLB2K_003137 [Fragaria x ananassa]